MSLMRCEGCGLECDDASRFKKISRVPVSRKTLCLACQWRLELRIQIWVFALAFVTLALTAAYGSIGRGWTWIIAAFLAYPFQIVALVAHELGHVVGGVIAGFRICKVRLGIGPVAANFHVAG